MFILQLPHSHNSFLCYFVLKLIIDLFFLMLEVVEQKRACSVMFNLIHGKIEKVRQMSGYGLTDL